MRILAASLLLATIANAEELRGKVVGISDGDTLTLLAAAPTKKTVPREEDGPW